MNRSPCQRPPDPTPSRKCCSPGTTKECTLRGEKYDTKCLRISNEDWNPQKNQKKTTQLSHISCLQQAKEKPKKNKHLGNCSAMGASVQLIFQAFTNFWSEPLGVDGWLHQCIHRTYLGKGLVPLPPKELAECASNKYLEKGPGDQGKMQESLCCPSMDSMAHG